MKLARPQGQKCTFRVYSGEACQASLVIDIFPDMPQIFSLKRVGDGIWETELQLAPGEYRFCYHLYDGRALHYLTPSGMETDGLKAVLHVVESVGLDEDSIFSAARLPDALANRRLRSSYPPILRRVAG